MDNLISREAVLNTVFSILCRWDTEDPDDLKNMLLLAFQELPAVDAVPVVRCKECKYGEQDDYGWICTNIDGGIMGDENGNGFCCEGERREE